MAPTTQQRILACLHGIATGDAVGKQTENLSREDVLRWYPNGVNGFEGPPGTHSTVPRQQEARMAVRRNDRRHRANPGRRERDHSRRRCHTYERRSRTAQVPQMRASGRQVTVGVPRKWGSRPIAQVMTDVERLFASHRWASCTGQHDSRISSLLLARRQSQHTEALLPSRRAAATAAAVSAAVDGLSAVEIIDLARRAAAMAEREHTDPPTTNFAEALDAMVHELRQWRRFTPQNSQPVTFRTTH